MKKACKFICISEIKKASLNLGNLGSALVGIGKYPEAKEMYERTLIVMQQMGDAPGAALTYGNLAVLYEKTGEVEKALECYHKVLPTLERVGDKHNAARFHNNLALLYSHKDNFPKPVPTCSRHLGCSKP